MATQEVILHPASVIAELKKNNISHVVWLPDSETNFMYQPLTNEPTLDLVPVCREGETIAIAAGLWVGGKRPVVLIQNTGTFEAGDSIPGSEEADWEGLAKSAGYAKVFTFDNLEDMTNGIDEALAAEGPAFVHLLVTPQIENTPVQFRQQAKRTVHTAIKELPGVLGVKG